MPCSAIYKHRKTTGRCQEAPKASGNTPGKGTRLSKQSNIAYTSPPLPHYAHPNLVATTFPQAEPTSLNSLRHSPETPARKSLVHHPPWRLHSTKHLPVRGLFDPRRCPLLAASGRCVRACAVPQGRARGAGALGSGSGVAAAAAERCCHCRGAEVREEWLARLFCWLGSVWVGAEIVLGCPTGSVSALWEAASIPATGRSGPRGTLRCCC